MLQVVIQEQSVGVVSNGKKDTLEHEVAYLRKQLGMLWEMCQNGLVPPKIQKRMTDVTTDMQVKDDLLADVIARQEELSIYQAMYLQKKGHHGGAGLFSEGFGDSELVGQLTQEPSSSDEELDSQDNDEDDESKDSSCNESMDHSINLFAETQELDSLSTQNRARVIDAVDLSCKVDTHPIHSAIMAIPSRNDSISDKAFPYIDTTTKAPIELTVILATPDAKQGNLSDEEFPSEELLTDNILPITRENTKRLSGISFSAIEKSVRQRFSIDLSLNNSQQSSTIQQSSDKNTLFSKVLENQPTHHSKTSLTDESDTTSHRKSIIEPVQCTSSTNKDGRHVFHSATLSNSNQDKEARIITTDSREGGLLTATKNVDRHMSLNDMIGINAALINTPTNMNSSSALDLQYCSYSETNILGEQKSFQTISQHRVSGTDGLFSEISTAPFLSHDSDNKPLSGYIREKQLKNVSTDTETHASTDSNIQKIRSRRKSSIDGNSLNTYLNLQDSTQLVNDYNEHLQVGSNHDTVQDPNLWGSSCESTHITTTDILDKNDKVASDSVQNIQLKGSLNSLKNDTEAQFNLKTADPSGIDVKETLGESIQHSVSISHAKTDSQNIPPQLKTKNECPLFSSKDEINESDQVEKIHHEQDTHRVHKESSLPDSRANFADVMDLKLMASNISIIDKTHDTTVASRHTSRNRKNENDDTFSHSWPQDTQKDLTDSTDLKRNVHPISLDAIDTESRSQLSHEHMNQPTCSKIPEMGATASGQRSCAVTTAITAPSLEEPMLCGPVLPTTKPLICVNIDLAEDGDAASETRQPTAEVSSARFDAPMSAKISTPTVLFSIKKPPISAAPLLSMAPILPPAPLLSIAPTLPSAPSLLAAPILPSAPLLSIAPILPSAPSLSMAPILPKAPTLPAPTLLPAAPILTIQSECPAGESLQNQIMTSSGRWRKEAAPIMIAKADKAVSEREATEKPSQSAKKWAAVVTGSSQKRTSAVTSKEEAPCSDLVNSKECVLETPVEMERSPVGVKAHVATKIMLPASIRLGAAGTRGAAKESSSLSLSPSLVMSIPGISATAAAIPAPVLYAAPVLLEKEESLEP
ncbi:hypothetical protein BASA81_011814 [Batrachochytrium salamandrivorans]|nr:hypothetical protein BASA81_011814 [Batrachochytrium salamandrivorans]